MSCSVKIYHHVRERAVFLHRLLTDKIIPTGMKTLIHANEKEATELDNFLWTWKAHDFLPHAIVENTVDDDTPVGIISKFPTIAITDVLILWSFPEDGTLPDIITDFGIVIDIIGDNVDEIKKGRERYQIFQDKGCQIESHKISN